ncbi:MAG: response regulator [bacterium]|nr:response regulator [bacterium]
MSELCKILIVDDLPDYLQSLKNVLVSEFDVVTATSFSEAKEGLSSEIDLLLSDIRLDEDDPDNKDGIRLLEWTKKNFPDIPVVLMSVYRDFDMAVDAVNLGVAKFLKKPINILELKSTLKDVLEKG